MPATHNYTDLLDRLLRTIDRASECYLFFFIPGNYAGTELASGMSRPLRSDRVSKLTWSSLLNSMLNKRSYVIAIVSVMDTVLNELDYATLFVDRVITKYLSYGSVVGSYGICRILEPLLHIEDAMETGDENILERCSELLHYAAEQALKIKAHRSVYDIIRMKAEYQDNVKDEVNDLLCQSRDISFGGLRVRCFKRYRTAEVARWIMMEAIVKSGIPVKGQLSDVSYISSVRHARSISVVNTSFCITFDENLNREDGLALTPWWTPSEDGGLYCSDSLRSWFIRWERQIVIHNNFRTLYAPVLATEVQEKLCGVWIRWRCIELRQVPFEVNWNSIFEMGDLFTRLGSKIGAQHKKIKDVFSNTREEMHPMCFDAARQVLLHIYREWPTFADVFVKGTMRCMSIVSTALRTTEASEWAKQILRRAVAGVSGSSMKVTLPNDMSVVLMGNRMDSSSADLEVKLTKGGALVQSSTVVRTVQTLVNIANTSASLSLDQIASLITGIKIVNARLAADSILPRNDAWLSSLFWPQADNILLGGNGPEEPDEQFEFDEYFYTSRFKILSVLLIE